MVTGAKRCAGPHGSDGTQLAYIMRCCKNLGMSRKAVCHGTLVLYNIVNACCTAAILDPAMISMYVLLLPGAVADVGLLYYTGRRCTV